MKIKLKTRMIYRFYWSRRKLLKQWPTKRERVNRSLKSGVEAFHILDSQGKLIGTRHLRILAGLQQGMANVNMMVKMYAQEMLPKNQGSIHFVELNRDLRLNGWPLCFRRAISKMYKIERSSFYANL